jgi:hypothetical protein
MKIIRLLVSILLTAFVFSACQPLENGDLHAVATQRTFILDTTATSCYSTYGGTIVANDLSSLSMDNLNLSLTNPAPGPATAAGTINIAYIEVTLYSSNIQNGQKTFTFGGDNLKYTWWGSQATAGTDAIIYPGETRQNACPFKLGGIAFVDKSQYTVGTGRVYIYGITIDNGEQVPVTDQTNFDWIYNGKPK